MLLWITWTASGLLPSGGGKFTVEGPIGGESPRIIRTEARPTLWATPVTLANQEATGQDFVEDLPTVLVHDRLLSLNDGTGLTLVIDTDDFVPQLKIAPCTSRRKWFEDGELALTVNTVAMI